jgi:predicted phage tail protein
VNSPNRGVRSHGDGRWSSWIFASENPSCTDKCLGVFDTIAEADTMREGVLSELAVVVPGLERQLAASKARTKVLEQANAKSELEAELLKLFDKTPQSKIVH